MTTNLKATVRSYDSLVVGEQVTFQHTILDEDIVAFAALSGDHNPLHTDEDYAKTTQFGGKVVHGLYLGSPVSRLVGMELPGRYALLVKESLEFKKPVMVGDTVVVSGTLDQKSDATKLIRVDVTITVVDVIVVRGDIIVRVLE
jgi:acyl dehydratase